VSTPALHTFVSAVCWVIPGLLLMLKGLKVLRVPAAFEGIGEHALRCIHACCRNWQC
jgi:hypothetical protein